MATSYKSNECEDMKYCQGPKCHEYRTKDRIRGSKGDKHYETRKRSHFYESSMATACSIDLSEMIGSISSAAWLLIISVELQKQSERAAMPLGIRIMIIDIILMVLVVSIIDLLMIYLVNAYQSRNNNMMMRT